MKRNMILSLLLMAIMTVATVQTEAQSATRIQFAKGKNSATVKGNTGSYGVSYAVKARSGQKMILTLAPTANLGIKVETNGEMVLLREEKGGTYEVYLEESGDFTIFIGSINHKSVPFTLTVKITKMADI